MITLTPEIETAITARQVRYVDLFRVDLGSYNATPYVYYWSDRAIPDTVTFDGRNYEARITRDSMSKLPRSKRGKTDLTISNHDGLVTDLYSAGISLIQGRVSVVRIFPDLDPEDQAVGDWTNPYWHGRITEVRELTAEAASVTVEFGWLDLTKRFGRVLGQTCPHLFADGFHCPYAPAEGYGRANEVTTGTATGADATHLYHTGKDFSAVTVGDVVVASNGTDGTSGEVTVKATGTLTVGSWSHGTPASGWHYEVGPAHTTCRYTVGDCEDRGMYGPSDNVAANQLNWSRRRYFGGWAEPAKTSIQVRQRSGLGYTKYRTLPQGSDGVHGRPVQVPVGYPILRGLKPVAWINAGQFQHLVYVLGEGRIGGVSPWMQIDGHGIDNVGSTTQGLKDDSLIIFGADAYVGTANDTDAVTSGELTEAQRARGVGILDSWAYQQGGKLSTYADNPFRFNSAGGSGIGPANCALIRVRVEAEFDPAGAEAVVQLTGGTLMKRLNGTWTAHPDPIEVFYNAMTHPLWGAGLSDGQLNLDALTEASDWCRAMVPKVQSEWAAGTNVASGNVAFGPEGGTGPGGDHTADWIYIATTTDPQIWVGAVLIVTVDSVEYDRKIVLARPDMTDPVFSELPGGYGKRLDVPPQTIGAWLVVDQVWESSAIPSAGDAYVIKATTDAQGKVQRFTANGVLGVQEKKLEDALEDILRGCNADWYQHLGKVSVAVRAQVDTGGLTTPVLTDKGNSRNVLPGSALLIEKAVDRSYNAVRVEFPDRTRAGEITAVVIKSSEAQLEQKARFGDQIRDEVKGSVFLPITNNLEEAARVGSMIARQRGIRSDGRRNYEITLEMPAHLAMKLEPIRDVCGLDLEGMPSFVQFGRVEDIDEGRTAAVASVKLSLYHHDDHADNPYDFHRDRQPGEITDSEGRAVRFRLVSATETVTTDRSGGPHSMISVKYTLPQ